MARDIVLLKSRALGPLEITAAAWASSRADYEAMGYRQASAAEVAEHTGNTEAVTKEETEEATQDEAADAPEEETTAVTKRGKRGGRAPKDKD